MSTLAGIFKPEYIYRPGQLFRRLFARQKRGFVSVRLPWGANIRVSVDDNVGGQIATLGLYDLVVTETLWRLCEPEELVIDVGANIGYTSFVMAQRINSGRLLSFEPHPVIYQELRHNITSLAAQGCKARVETHEFALGPIATTLPLHVPKDFAYHRGESSLAVQSHLELSSETVDVTVKTLDSVIADTDRIGVMKMDVEGFELDVLRGAERLFAERRVRDCVFEEHNLYPTPVTNWFESHGYTVFRLDRRFSGLVVLPPDSQSPRTYWTATSFVATSDPRRLQDRLSDSGWHCLRPFPKMNTEN